LEYYKKMESVPVKISFKLILSKSK
jgi:hypothetical protein